MEALVRWKDEKEGIVPPNRFLPVLEREGRLYELDRAVLREICRMLKERIAEEKPVVPVSINLSWQDFLREDTFRFFERTLADANLQRNLVRIELGEKSLVDGTTRLRMPTSSATSSASSSARNRSLMERRSLSAPSTSFARRATRSGSTISAASIRRSIR